MRCLRKINTFLLELCYFTGYLGNETSLITGLINIEAAQNWALTFTFICWASSPTSPNQVEKKIIEQRGASLPLLQRREAVFNHAKYKWDSRRNASSCGEHDRDDVIWLKDSKKRRRSLTQAWVPLSLSHFISGHSSLWSLRLPSRYSSTPTVDPSEGSYTSFCLKRSFLSFSQTLPHLIQFIFSNIRFVKSLSLMILFKIASPHHSLSPYMASFFFHRLITQFDIIHLSFICRHWKVLINP